MYGEYTCWKSWHSFGTSAATSTFRGCCFETIFSGKNPAEILENYWSTRSKLDGGADPDNEDEFWETISTIFEEKIYEVVYEQYKHYKDKAVTEGMKVASLAKTSYAYHAKLHSLAINCLEAMENMRNNKIDDTFDTPIQDRLYWENTYRMATHFLYFYLFLYAVPQPIYKDDDRRDYIKIEPNKDVAWMLVPCKIYQDNTEFMALMRDLSVVLIYVDRSDLHVPRNVLDICQYYAKLARDDNKARVFERHLLNHIKRDGDSTLTPDHVKEIVDHSKYKPKQEIKAIAKYNHKKVAMRVLLCRLRSL